MARLHKLDKICKVQDCSSATKARGWCNKHWYRWHRNGDPLKTTKNYETHGKHKEQGYSSWKGIKQRVLNPNNPRFEYYGGRGITVCDGVSSSFRQFIESIGDRPNTSLTVDRIDNDSGYWCGDCSDCEANGQGLNMRWATRSEQQHNSRRYEVAV